MATKTGLLLTKTVKDKAQTLESIDGDDLLSVVIERITNSPQFKIPILNRRPFLKILESKDSRDSLQLLVCLLAKEYSLLFLEGKKAPAGVRYCSFQIRWIQRVRTVVQRGERALNGTQCDDDDDDDKRGAAIADKVAVLLQYAYGNELNDSCPLDSRGVLAVFHTIAREVFLYQQSRASYMVSTADAMVEISSTVPIDSDEALYRISGAQLHRMLQIIMSEEEKDKFLPSSLKSTERGGRTFPKPCILPFIRRIVTYVKSEITEDAFKLYGENLFKVTETELQCNRSIFECFKQCSTTATTETFSEQVQQACAADLVSKITNCCKKDWDVARKRQQQHLEGNATTLNLRDILKAHVAK